MAAPKSTRPDLVAASTFVLRTPLLPRDELDRWGADLAVSTASDGDLDAALAHDRELLRARLRAIVERPEVREAIFVASPNLEASIDAWRTSPTSEAGLRTERGLVRYISRMASRPTPFGLFAGNTVGTIGETTALALAPHTAYRRYTRLDGDYLSDLTDALGADAEIRGELRYRPNSSLCMVAGRLRYAMRKEGSARSYSLVSIEPSDFLVATLERARGGAVPAALATALADADPEVTREEADDFIAELIATQILVSDLAPPVTGPEAVDDVIAQLGELTSPLAVTARDALGLGRRALASLDGVIGNPAAAYRAVAETLAPLPAEIDITRLFQVNLVPVGETVTLGRDLVDEIARGLGVLRRLARPRGQDDVARFREAFAERYEAREVPLVEVLDEESGIGFAMSTAPGSQASPLLDGLPFPGGAGADETLGWGRSVTYLLNRVSAAVAAGAAEVDLDERDLEAMGTDAPTEVDALAALVTLARTADGGYEAALESVSGPPGATFLGRFCHSDPALHATVREHLAAEEALQPDVLFAEIVHLADGRLANISARPVLRRHEIVFLGRSGAPREHQIEVTDLAVSVRNDRVVLRSMRLQREVIPRLTNAHNFSAGSLGMYRFLASLQHQNRRFLQLPAGALSPLPYAPRVRHGRIVLRGAQWRIAGTELAPVIDGKGAARVRALHALRTARALPRWICIEDGDNVLPVDLENALSVDSFAHLVRGRPGIAVSELWPAPAQLAVRGPAGGFANELVVPFVRVAAPAARVAQPVAPSGRSGAPRARFAPGSEWLYARLFTGTAAADQVLEALAPVLADLPRWFFIRYGDPKWHVRLRVHGDPRWLLAEVAPRIAEAMRPLVDDERVYRIQYDTYEREVERYGARGIELAERWFHADSVAVVAILGLLAGDAGLDTRWRLAVRGIDQLFDDLGFDLPTKLAVMRAMRDSFTREHRVEKHVPFQRKLGDRYRADRAMLDALLDHGQDAASELAPALAQLDARSRASQPIMEALRAADAAGELSLRELAPSYAHMHANRMLRSAQRANELVIYDLLARLYESRVARSKPKKAK